MIAPFAVAYTPRPTLTPRARPDLLSVLAVACAASSIAVTFVQLVMS